MTTFTRAWSGTYEATPANSEDASLGAQRIRETRLDLRERLDVDHFLPGDDSDGTAEGEHRKLSFYGPLGADPTNAANKGFLYLKDVNSVVELFWEDESGNVLQVTSAGKLLAPHVIESKTASASASLDFTTGITSAYTHYRLVFQNLLPSADGANLIFRIQETGAFKSGASDYKRGFLSAQSSAAVANNATVNAIHCGSNPGNVAADEDGVSGYVDIFNPAATGVVKMVSGASSTISNTGELRPELIGGAYTANGNAITGFQLLFDSGNITSGAAKLITFGY